MRNQPLFEKPPAPPKPKLSKALEAHRSFRGTYAKYSPVKRIACDECINLLHEAGDKGEPPLSARHTRKSGQGALRLCHPHNALWREIDGVGRR